MRPAYFALRAALLALVTLGLAACEAPTDPSRRTYSDIFAIEVPSAVRAADTLTIAFRYHIHCGTLPTVDVQIRDATVSVAVWVPVSDAPFVCQGISLSARTAIVVPPEAHAAGSTEIRFRQSAGPDSIRVVTPAAAAVRAP